MKITVKNLALTLAVGALISSSAFSYDIVKRAKLTDDRFKTLEMMRPIGHDFFIDINGSMSTDVQDLIDTAKEIDKIEQTNNFDTDMDAVNKKLDPFYNKEQILRANVGLGFPIFSFDAFGVNWKPNFRVRAGLFAMLTPSKVSINLTDIINSFTLIPESYRTALISCINNETPSPGANLLDVCSPNYISATEATYIKENITPEIPYYSEIKTVRKETPAVDIYAKAEAKAGFFVDYKKGKHWFGDFGFYGLGRADIKKRADGLLLLGGGGKIDVADNTNVNAAFDYKLGYKNSNYSVAASVEELKLTNVKESKEGTLAYGDDPLLRLHAQADYRLWIFKLSPYLGSHARSGYGFGDAYYVGADWGMYVWGDRLGLNFKTQMDKEHFTLGARAKLWFFHADLSTKIPVKSEVDGIKVNSVHSANIRFFF